MLSNLMTAKSLDENPASHARANTVKTIKLLAPEGFNNLELDIACAGGPTVPVLAAMTLYRHWASTSDSGQQSSANGRACNKLKHTADQLGDNNRPGKRLLVYKMAVLLSTDEAAIDCRLLNLWKHLTDPGFSPFKTNKFSDLN